MVGVVSGQMAGVARRQFAVGRLPKRFVATAAVTVASVAMMTAPAMMSQASAQSFTQALVFGDSSVDSGFYKVLGNPNGPATNKFNIAFAAAIAAGGTGAPTNSPGLMNSQVLAAYFGLTADPANQPGGTNFATSGAKNVLVNTAANGGFPAAIPTVQQIDNYLASVGGHANGNGLYMICKMPPTDCRTRSPSSMLPARGRSSFRVSTIRSSAMLRSRREHLLIPRRCGRGWRNAASISFRGISTQSGSPSRRIRPHSAFSLLAPIQVKRPVRCPPSAVLCFQPPTRCCVSPIPIPQTSMRNPI